MDFTPDDVYAMSGYELDIPAFHTKRGYRVINMVVNGTSVSSESGVSEVPISKGDTVSSVPRNLDLTTKMTDSYTTTRGVEQNCSYEYKMDLKVRTGKFEDYNFNLSTIQRRTRKTGCDSKIINRWIPKR